MAATASRVIERLDPVTRGWIVVVGGGLVRLGLGFLASVLIARALGPADFGRLAVLAAVSGIAGALADLGLTESAVKRIASVWPAQPEEARRRWAAFFWVRAGVAVAVGSAGCLAAVVLAEPLVGLPVELITLALVGVVATALSGAASAGLQATGRFGRLATVTLVNAGLTATLAVVLLAYGSLTLLTALVVLGIATSVASLLAGLLLLPSGWRLSWPRVGDLRSEGRALSGFARWLAVANLLAMLAGQIDVLLVSRWSTPAEVGAYALAVGLASKVDLVHHGLYTVLLPAASALEDRGAIRRYLRGTLRRSALVGAGLLALAPLAGPLIELCYGAAYAPAAGLFRWLLIVVAFDLLATPLLLLAYPLHRPRLLALAGGVQTAVLTVTAVWLIPAYGPVGAIAAKLLASVAATAVTLGALRRVLSGGTQAEH